LVGEGSSFYDELVARVLPAQAASLYAVSQGGGCLLAGAEPVAGLASYLSVRVAAAQYLVATPVAVF
jgi:hypothetical protein